MKSVSRKMREGLAVFLAFSLSVTLAINIFGSDSREYSESTSVNSSDTSIYFENESTEIGEPAMANESDSTAATNITNDTDMTNTPDATTEPTATVTPDATTKPTETNTPDATTKPTETNTPDATTEPTATLAPSTTVDPDATSEPNILNDILEESSEPEPSDHEAAERISDEEVNVLLPTDISFDIVLMKTGKKGIVNSKEFAIINNGTSDIVVEFAYAYIGIPDADAFSISDTSVLPDEGNNIYVEMICVQDDSTVTSVLPDHPLAPGITFRLESGGRGTFQFSGVVNELGDIPWSETTVTVYICFEMNTNIDINTDIDTDMNEDIGMDMDMPRKESELQ